MEKGNMDRIIEIQHSVPSRSDSGQVIYDWERVPQRGKVWAAVSADKGAEQFIADKKTPRQYNIFRIIYREDIDESMTILYGGKRWDITSIQELRRRRGLLIYASYTQGQYDD